MAIRSEFTPAVESTSEVIAANRAAYPKYAKLGGPETVGASPTPGAITVPFLALPAAIVGTYHESDRVSGFAPTVLLRKKKIDGFVRDAFEVFAGRFHDLWYATDAGWNAELGSL